MSILQSILQYKQMEREREMADINAIGTSVSNFINLQKQNRKDALSERLIESQIQQNQPSALDELLQRGKAAEAAKNLGDRDLFFSIIGQKDPLKQENTFQVINNEIDDASKISDRATDILYKANNENQLDQFLNEVDPMTGKPTPMAMRAEEEFKSQSQAKKEVFSQEAKNKEKLGRLDKIVTDLESKFESTSPYDANKVIPGTVPLLGAWDIVKKGLGGTDAQRKDQAYASFVSGIRAQLARAMGDVGNLSEYEQKAVMQLIPTLQDSKQSAKLKLQGLRDFVSSMTGDKKEFGSLEEAEKANLPVGTVLYINGRKAVVE